VVTPYNSSYTGTFQIGFNTSWIPPGVQALTANTQADGNVAISSVPQFQSLAQTLVTAKSADGNIVQLRPANLNRPVIATSTAGSLTTANLQGIKPLQATTKRPATGTAGQMRNVSNDAY
jgi:FlaG/FlaF family flagellin (archaellin)